MESAQSRLLWPDAAKGTAMILVVFTHVVTKHVTYDSWDVSPSAESALLLLVDAFTPIRMPLFFVVSGMLATHALNRPWPILLRTRIATLYYLYVVWLLIQTAVYTVAGTTMTDVADGPRMLAQQLTVRPSTLWYLYALAVYFTLAKLGVRAKWITFLGAVALNLVSEFGYVPEWGNLPSVARNFMWFVLGAALSLRLLELGSMARWQWLFVSVGAFAPPMLVMWWLGGKAPVPFLLASAAGASLMLTVVVLLCRHLPEVARALAFVGQRTLQVYVLHLPAIALWSIVAPMVVGSRILHGAVAIGYTVVLVLVIVTATVAVPLRQTMPWLAALPTRPQRSSAIRGTRRR